jgi:RNA polymerase sigma-70 factor (ECF subfamily)
MTTMTEISDPSVAFFNHRHQLQAYLWSMTSDAHLSEDLLQEVWLAFSKAQTRGDQIENIPAWSRGVARHLCQKHWRDKGRRPLQCRSDILDLVDQAFDEQDDEDHQRSRREALWSCMETLPASSKALLRQKYHDNLSFEEMAVKEQKKASSLMVTVSRLRKKLKNCIEAKQGSFA